MKLTLPLLALLLAGSAQADEYGSCSIGNTAFTSSRDNCAAHDGVFYPITLSYGMPVVAPSATVTYSGSITAAIAAPACPKEREVVLRASGQYGCAKDVQLPEDLK